MNSIHKLYNTRFNNYERIRKIKLWQVLCEDFLQQFIRKNDCVVDLGAGTCEFINSIRCGKKIALDSSPEAKKHAKKEVEVIIGSVKNIYKLLKNKKPDVIFMSNLLEHLDSKEEAFRLLVESYRILVPKGKLLIMQPDIARVGNAYWDFFDHKIAITQRSLFEALETVGFKISYFKDPFLPYTTKTTFLPLWSFLLRIYLRVRLLHFIFGKQFFVCAQKC